MSAPTALILRAPGTNCDDETAFAFRRAGAKTERVHVNRVLDDPAITKKFQILCIPGGFSYGDDIAAGRILANQCRYHLSDALREFKEAGKLILGICNGFQVLAKSGLLFNDDRQAATLTWNESGKYEDRWVYVRVEGTKSIFLQGIDSAYLPIAHAEGKFVIREGEEQRLQREECLVMRYTDRDGARNGQVGYPSNPNGSQANVAGACDKTGRVLGMMPHPERYIDRTHHPRWTRGEGQDPGDGFAIFKNAVRYFL